MATKDPFGVGTSEMVVLARSLVARVTAMDHAAVDKGLAVAGTSLGGWTAALTQLAHDAEAARLRVSAAEHQLDAHRYDHAQLLARVHTWRTVALLGLRATADTEGGVVGAARARLKARPRWPGELVAWLSGLRANLERVRRDPDVDIADLFREHLGHADALLAEAEAAVVLASDLVPRSREAQLAARRPRDALRRGLRQAARQWRVARKVSGLPPLFDESDEDPE